MNPTDIQSPDQCEQHTYSPNKIIMRHRMAWLSMRHPNIFSRLLLVSVLFLLQCTYTIAAAENGKPAETKHLAAAVGANAVTELDALTAKAQSKGQVPVILRLNVNFQAESRRSASGVITQRNAIADARRAVVQSLAGKNATNIKEYQYVPYLAVTVNSAALQALAKNPKVSEISEDVPVPPTLAESTGVIGADIAWQAGYDGSGWAVAVLDTGVDKNHNFLSGKVISEACYSTTSPQYRSTSLCPGGVNTTATNSGLSCPLTTDGCDHGTHVAGIIAGEDYTPNGPGYNGVAKGANIIAIQVFSQFTGTRWCGQNSPCVLSWTSDQISGLERVYQLRTDFNIAAANMSLGGGEYTSNCDSDVTKSSIDNLRAADIATVIASGNSYYTDAMGAPACISTAVSVGATCDSATTGFGCTAVDGIPNYSNIASFISLLAPGSLISSSTPGTNTFQSWHGTSMATPHVAGAWALMKQRDPGATVSEVLATLQNTGTIVDDQRASGTVTGMRRINVDNALTVSDADSDGDGLNNIYEVTVLGTNPENVDSDGDGLVDGTDGFVLIIDLPGGIDSDGDGFVDGEQDTGTDPLTTNIIGDIAPRHTPNYQLDAGDLAVLTRLVTGVNSPTPLESALGDINGDTNINAADLLLLQQLLIAP